MATNEQEVEQLAESYRWSIRGVLIVVAAIAASKHADAVTPAWEKAGFWDRHIGQNVTNPAGVWMGYLFLAGIACWWAKVPARIMARSEVERRSVAAAAQAAQTQRLEAQAQEERLRNMERENARQDGVERLAQSKEQLVRQLGSVDQFVRAWEGESDAGKRCMALQGAQGVLTSVQAKLAAERSRRKRRATRWCWPWQGRPRGRWSG